MIQESVLQLLDGAVFGSWCQREILVGIEHHDMPETQSVLVAADEFLEYWGQREARAETEHALLSMPCLFPDSLFYHVGYALRPLLHGGEYFRVDFLLPCQFAPLHGISGAEQLRRHLVQHDLRTQIQIHINCFPSENALPMVLPSWM